MVRRGASTKAKTARPTRINIPPRALKRLNPGPAPVKARLPEEAATMGGVLVVAIPPVEVGGVVVVAIPPVEVGDVVVVTGIAVVVVADAVYMN
jgi:hypothetical protein